MILDYLLRFSIAQAITSGTTTNASTSYIDHQSATDVGPGTTVRLDVETVAAFTGTSQTLIVLIQDSADAITWTTKASSATFSSLGATTKLKCPTLPPGLRRYIRVGYTLGTAETTGTINAQLVIDENLNAADSIPGSP